MNVETFRGRTNCGNVYTTYKEGLFSYDKMAITWVRGRAFSGAFLTRPHNV